MGVGRTLTIVMAVPIMVMVVIMAMLMAMFVIMGVLMTLYLGFAFTASTYCTHNTGILSSLTHLQGEQVY